MFVGEDYLCIHKIEIKSLFHLVFYVCLCELYPEKIFQIVIISAIPHKLKCVPIDMTFVLAQVYVHCH